MTGIRNLFEGEAGLFNVYFKGEFNRNKILENLGTEFLSGGMVYKYWPAVGNAHTYIHAAIELMKENDVDLQEVEEVRVYVGDFQQRMCSPLFLRQAPETLVDAKFSLPFLVALSLAKGQMKIADFTIDALKDPTVLALARKVMPIPDSSFNWTSKLPDGKVEVVTRTGQIISRLGNAVPGTSERPMSWDELGQKFAECALAAAKPLVPEHLNEAAALIRKLEECKDVATLVNLIS
jgi:2-methylcitrate dehydratase PrpD